MDRRQGEKGSRELTGLQAEPSKNRLIEKLRMLLLTDEGEQIRCSGIEKPVSCAGMKHGITLTVNELRRDVLGVYMMLFSFLGS